MFYLPWTMVLLRQLTFQNAQKPTWLQTGNHPATKVNWFTLLGGWLYVGGNLFHRDDKFKQILVTHEI